MNAINKNNYMNATCLQVKWPQPMQAAERDLEQKMAAVDHQHETLIKAERH